LDRHSRLELPQIQPVVDVIPQSRSLEEVALTRALLAGEAVGALAVLAGVPVTVGVEVEDFVVGRCAFQLEA
jgi:hypothetical protein